MFYNAGGVMTVTNIDAQTAKKWLDSGEAIMLDVREPVEYAAVSIQCAELKPLSSFSSDTITFNSNKKVIVHCRSGNRSQTACEKLSKAHPNIGIYNLEGGIVAWEKAGFDTIKQPTYHVLPLDRQVQLTVGILVLIGVLLGYIVSTTFLIIPLLIGAGLIFAGITGTCGLAMLLAKMPWNQKERAH